MILFKTSLKWSWSLALITFLLAIALTTDICLRSNEQDRFAVQNVAALNLSWTALAPAGTLLAQPQLHHSGIDLRFSPKIGLSAHSAGLLPPSEMMLKQ